MRSNISVQLVEGHRVHHYVKLPSPRGREQELWSSTDLGSNPASAASELCVACAEVPKSEVCSLICHPGTSHNHASLRAGVRIEGAVFTQCQPQELLAPFLIVIVSITRASGHICEESGVPFSLSSPCAPCPMVLLNMVWLETCTCQ